MTAIERTTAGFQLIIPGCMLMLSACAGEPKVISQTPGSIEIACVGEISGCASPQAVADLAQAHCQKYNLDARQSSIAMSPSGNRWVTYSCVGAVGNSVVSQNPASQPK